MRRLLRFNLKSLLVFCTLVPILLGLHVSDARRQEKSVQQIQDHGGWVAYDYRIVDGEFDASSESSVPAWLRRSLGDDFFHSVAEVSFFTRFDENGTLSVCKNPDVLPLGTLLSGVPRTKCLRLWGTQVTDKNLEAISELDHLESLVIVEGVNITDEGAAHLSRLRHLRWLVLTESQITDKSLQGISQLRNLRVLNLCSPHISDNGLQYLANHKRLETLFVHGRGDQRSAIDDKGIMSLCSMPNLAFLSVKDTHVTDSGMSTFMMKRPNCKIQR